MIQIYTDGACSKNGYEGSSGGFGYVAVENEKVVRANAKMSNGETTNNREELKAILSAAITFGGNEWEIEIFSDSAYCINTLSNWMYGWQKRGWLKSDNKTPENLDLIKIYYYLVQDLEYKIKLTKVKGHSGVKWNEIADSLATGRIKPEEIMEES